MPLSYRDYAFLTCVYLINRLPTTTLNLDVPYTKLFQKLPDYSFLKAFGCSYFPLLRPYISNKLQFRFQECLFLGYSTSHKGYKCLSPTGRLYISKDVISKRTDIPYISNSYHLLLFQALLTILYPGPFPLHHHFPFNPLQHLQYCPQHHPTPQLSLHL